MRTVAGPSLRPRRGPVILATAAVAAVGILGVGGFTTYRQLVLAPPADCQLAQRLIDTGADLSPNYPAHAQQWVRVLHQEATRIGDSSLRERITGYLNLAEPLVTGLNQTADDRVRQQQDRLAADIRSRCPHARVAFPPPAASSPR